MSLGRAATFLLWASARNRVRRQLARLKQPRYAFATAVGLLYFWNVFVRQVFAARVRQVPRDLLPAVELVMVAVGLGSVASSWLFRDDEVTLRFTEAEAQLLFPAPVSRRALINYKLLRTLGLTLFSALLTTLLMGSRLAPHPTLFLLGAWLGYSILSLHLTAASLARASLAAHGFGGARRQLASLAVLAGVVAAAVLAARGLGEPLPAGPVDAAALVGWAATQMSKPPLAWVLYPVLAPARLALAPDWATGLAQLPGALAVLAAHYAWALSTDVAFEEAALEAARRRAERIAGYRAGAGLLPIQRVRPPFRLAAAGRPEVALLWKNLVGLLRANALRAGLVVAYLGAVTAVVGYALLQHRAEWKFAVATLLCLALSGYLALLGPLVLRSDLRADLPQMDMLRALPLTGRQAVLGEVAAPALALTLAQWALLTFGALLSLQVEVPWFTRPERLGLALAAALVLPGVSLLSLLVQNAAALLFPAWVSNARGASRGFEATGQRLLSLAGNLLVLVAGLIPAALLGGLVLWLAWGLGPLRAPLAGAVAAAVLLVEARLGLELVGGLFERFDLGQ